MQQRSQIIRLNGNLDGNFTQVRNDLLRADKSLSDRALRLGVYMFTHVTGWAG